MASKKEPRSETDGQMVLVLKALLLRLEAEEALKPAGARRQVPTANELADAAGVHRATMYDYINGAVKRFNFEVGSAILTALWRRGFRVTVSDLIIFHPPDEHE